LDVVDINDPYHSAQIGAFTTRAIAYGVAVSDTLAFIAADTAGLLIVNIATPSAPHLIGSYNTAGSARAVAIYEHYAVVADYSAGLQVIDVSDPTSPQLEATYDTPGTAIDVDVAGNRAYIADNQGGLKIIDLTNPANPTLLGSVASYTQNVIIHGHYAYLSGLTDFRIVDVSTPASPRQTYLYSIQTGDARQVGGIGVYGNSFYVSWYNSFTIPYPEPRTYYTFKFWVLDITNPDSATLSADADWGGLLTCIAPTSQYVYYAPGFNVLPINNLSSLHAIDSLTMTNGSYNLQVDNHRAYLTSYPLFEILDVTNSSYPPLLGTYNYHGEPDRIVVTGSNSYLLFNNRSQTLLYSILVLNTADPTAIQVIHDYGPIQNTIASDIAVVNSEIFIALSEPSTFKIFSMSNGNFVGTCNLSAGARGMAVSGNYAYITNWNGIDVVNASNYLSPQLIGSLSLGCYGPIAISGNYMYVVGRDSCLWVASIATPSDPQIEGFCQLPVLPNYSTKLKIVGNYLYLADGPRGGIRILNITAFNHPYEIGFYNTPGSCLDLDVVNDTIYVADNTNFGIYDCSQALGVVDRASSSVPENFSLKQNYPNPFNSSTTIEYTIPKTGKVEMKLYDITGRMVGTLVNFNQNPGTYRVKLDGTKLSSGIYFCRLNSGGMTQTTKLTLLK